MPVRLFSYGTSAGAPLDFVAPTTSYTPASLLWHQREAHESLRRQEHREYRRLNPEGSLQCVTRCFCSALYVLLRTTSRAIGLPALHQWAKIRLKQNSRSWYDLPQHNSEGQNGIRYYRQ